MRHWLVLNTESIYLYCWTLCNTVKVSIKLPSYMFTHYIFAHSMLCSASWNRSQLSEHGKNTHKRGGTVIQKFSFLSTTELTFLHDPMSSYNKPAQTPRAFIVRCPSAKASKEARYISLPPLINYYLSHERTMRHSKSAMNICRFHLT
jgi:hypothetical protein